MWREAVQVVMLPTVGVTVGDFVLAADQVRAELSWAE